MSQALRILAVADPAVFVYQEQHEAIFGTFEQAFKTKVEIEIIPFPDYYGRMNDELAAGGNFDIVMIAGHLWLGEQVRKGRLKPLQRDLPEGLLPAIYDELFDQGTRYLAPSFCDGHLFVYRKPYVNRTLSDVVTPDEIIRIAREAPESMYGIALKAAPSEIFLDVLPYLRVAGVTLFDEKAISDFRTEQAVQALASYCALQACAPNNTGEFANDEVRNALQDGSVAGAVTWGGQMGFVMDQKAMKNPDELGFAAVKGAWNVTWSFAVNAKSANPELSEALLTHLCRPEVDRIVGAYAGSPLFASTYEQDEGRYPWYRAHKMLLTDIAEPLPKRDDTGALMAPLYEAFTKAFRGEVTPEEAIHLAYERMIEVSGKEGLT
ncbi:extracellular solute-binding protein [Salisediminibacterium selenitireducens]|uniref:Extracellular solute-binding protein family 1 n=1 Tax=Bacillus selenitireducens (strain ATCC 700615 / DSM 15326 / MLS10) TaxID=439292 RepID=D6Y0M3_BACIE|nr:extracellular solute-binding protein [Salisediminibacterium selenitireducens]ADI00591.1 extracellular solute-binding protein family 1 [[Bacillus] selenitireducens MLS10]